jgi:hypothetical protein
MTSESTTVLIQIFCAIFAGVAMIYVFLPSKDLDTGVDKTRLGYLFERKDVIYDNLRDLNFEFKSGKFTQADYDVMRAGMEAEAARVLSEIEQLEAVQA